MVPQQRGQHGAAQKTRTDMGKISVTGTVYLVTVERGDYYKQAIPFRLYATRAKAERFLTRLKRHHAKKPKEPEGTWALNLTDDQQAEHTAWWAALQQWQNKHPGGPENAYASIDEWEIRPMPIC